MDYDYVVVVVVHRGQTANLHDVYFAVQNSFDRRRLAVEWLNPK